MKHPLLAASLGLVVLFSFISPALCAPLEVFVSIPPQKWLSDQLGGPLVITRVLVGKGQDPHTYEPTPQQITALSQAKIFFTIDLQFEEQILPKVKKTVPNLHLINTADAISKIAMTEQGHDEPGHDRPEQAVHGPNDGAQTTGERHHAGLDPHVWLSPLNLKIMAATMTRALCATDPANQSVYEKNLLSLNQKLEQAHQEITHDLTPFQGASFLVFHPAFGYFAHAYHLQQRAVETGGKSPSPRQLANLIREARESGVRAIFVQPQFDPKSAEVIAKAINGEVIPLDPLAEDVLSSLKIMAARIKTALSAR
jgi:zinc transport system substrate-binding protein